MGTQLDVHNITREHGEAGELSAEQVAGYVAKYATKATESFGSGLDRRLTGDDVEHLDRLPAHVAELVCAAWDLGGRPELERLRLRAWAHMLGFGGHWSTKSRRYSTTYRDSGLVITTEDGRPFHPETLSGLFVRQAKRAGLPPIRLHDLRHSVASILLARGVHPKVVSEMLGHATIALTLDTYSHVIPSLQQEAASVVAAADLDPASMLPEAPLKGQVRAITSGS